MVVVGVVLLGPGTGAIQSSCIRTVDKLYENVEHTVPVSFRVRARNDGAQLNRPRPSQPSRDMAAAATVVVVVVVVGGSGDIVVVVELNLVGNANGRTAHKNPAHDHSGSEGMTLS